MQLVATDGELTGFEPLTNVMTRVEGLVRENLAERWDDIERGIKSVNDYVDPNKRGGDQDRSADPYDSLQATKRIGEGDGVGYSWKRTCPSRDDVIFGISYAALLNILLREGKIYLRERDTYFDLSDFKDFLFADPEGIDFPPMLFGWREYRKLGPIGRRRHTADELGFGTNRPKGQPQFGDDKVLVSRTTLNALTFQEAAIRSRRVCFFDVTTWSVRMEPDMSGAVSDEEHHTLEEVWSALRPFKGTPLYYRTSKTFVPGKGKTPSQIEQSVRSQIEHMIAAKPPRSQSSLWHAAMDYFTAVLHLERETKSEVDTPWVCKELCNDTSRHSNNAYRRFGRDLNEEIKGKSANSEL